MNVLRLGAEIFPMTNPNPSRHQSDSATRPAARSKIRPGASPVGATPSRAAASSLRAPAATSRRLRIRLRQAVPRSRASAAALVARRHGVLRNLRFSPLFATGTPSEIASRRARRFKGASVSDAPS
jgi:hypothetical protein